MTPPPKLTWGWSYIYGKYEIYEPAYCELHPGKEPRIFIDGTLTVDHLETILRDAKTLIAETATGDEAGP